MENDLIRIISKINVIETDIAFQRDIGCCAVVLVEVLPGPEPCLFLGFSQLTVDFLGINQVDIAFILFRLFIQQGENTFCPGNAHHNRVDLGRNLLNGSGELPAHPEEGDNHCNGEGKAGNREVR